MIGGAEMQCACNMNAIMAFMQARGTDDFSAFANISQLKPSDLLPLIAACVHEGERLAGRECNITAEEIGEEADFTLFNDFLQIFGRAIKPAVVEEKK